MKSSGPGWATELLALFISGFLVATLLWLGFWFLWARPAETAALRAKEAALQAKETASRDCVAAKDQCERLLESLQGENKQLDAKLKEALKGWGNCIRSPLRAPEAQEKPQPNTP